VARAKARRGFGVGLDDDPRAGVFSCCAKTSISRNRDRSAPDAATEASPRVWSITSTLSRVGGGVGWVKAAGILVRCASVIRWMAPRARSSRAVSSSGCVVRMSSRSEGCLGSKCNPLWSTSKRPVAGSAARPGNSGPEAMRLRRATTGRSRFAAHGQPTVSCARVCPQNRQLYHPRAGSPRCRL